MRITHYFYKMRLEGGGPVRGVLDLTAALRRAGHDVRLATTDDRDVPAAWKAGAAEWPRVARLAPPALPGGLFSPSQRRMLREAFDGSDVVHLHGVWTPSNAQVARVCRELRTPYVWSIRGTLDDWCMGERALKKRAFLALGTRKTLESAAFCHLTAEDELRQARKWFPRGRGVVIPNLLDLAPFRTLPGPEEARSRFPLLRAGRPALLFLSRLHYKKGVPVLIEAAAVLRRQGVEVSVLIAGSGEPEYEARLRELIRREGLEDRVELVGFVSGALKLSLYQACELFVLPTSQENFGFVLFESLACGTPLVTTRGVDTWPELEASGGAVIVEAGASAVAESVRSLLRDRDRLAPMGESGRRWVFENLDPERIVTSFIGMYEKAARGVVA
ncbi:MAG TPA: glycosyltransferase [Phycisphaerales bacterium]|nr:glycosyltransferase [Phycisphaerales bacterium]